MRKNIFRKYGKQPIFKGKKQSFRIKKDFMELTDREYRDRKEKIKREIEELLHKLIIVSKDDKEKFEEQEMEKIRPIIRKWFDWLINKNVIRKKPEMIRDKIKDKIIRDISRRLETKKEERKKKKHNGRINNDKIIRDIRTLFETKKEKEERMKRKNIMKDQLGIE